MKRCVGVAAGLDKSAAGIAAVAEANLQVDCKRGNGV